MRIPRLLLEQELTSGALLELPAETLRHAVTVLRLPDGAPCRVFDGRGQEFLAQLQLSGRRSGRVLLGDRAAEPTTPPLKIRLLQGIARSEHMDFALQKSVELGVSTIVPVLTQRSRSAGGHRGLENKQRHWQGIIRAAAEQCGRNEVPQLEPTLTLEALLADPDCHAAGYATAPMMKDVRFFHANTQDEWRFVADASGTSLDNLPSLSPEQPAAINLLIGPEGGWDPDELTRLRARDWIALALGPRILRTETATVVALTLLQLRWGDLNADRL